MSRTLLSSSLFLLFLGVTSAQDQLQPLMGQPLRGLTATQADLFLKGRTAFDTALTDIEGLGPIFNEPSCGSCHNLPATGGAGTRAVTRFGKAGNPFDPLADLGGSLLQDQSLDLACREEIPVEADVIAMRLTPICFGAGLLETLEDPDIVANQANGGVVSMVGDLENPNAPLRPARFGWKGVVANVVTFSIDASLNEMGLTTVFLPVENAPNGDQALLAACDNVGDPEDSTDADGKTRIERFTDFQRYLAAPAQTPRDGMTGELLFDQVGCAVCHVATYVTGTAPEPALSNKTVHPYSDFLLHDMGAQGDQIDQGNAAETVMMTRALWGVSQRVSFMHDGGVTGGTFHENMVACIDAHVGEGVPSRDAFNQLSPVQQEQVTDFLESLGQAEFDFENDNDLDEFDWFFIEPALTGPVPTYGPDSPESINDVDQDGDFDLHEFALFQRGFTGQTFVPDLPGVFAQGFLSLELRAGANTVYVAPGGRVRYDVLGKLSNNANQGLAMFSFDLDFDGGALPQASSPTMAPMDNFANDLGLSNPTGFGGTPTGGDLLQVGGGQNSIKNTFAPRPIGDVILEVAKINQVLVEGEFDAPMAPGTYGVDVTNWVGNVFTDDTTGDPFWMVEGIEIGPARGLVVRVQDGAPDVYCTSKVTSEGCAPEIEWKGLATLTGQDNFVIRASKVPTNTVGYILWSTQSGNTPFMGGTLCLGGTINRSQAITSGAAGLACDGLFEWHMDQAYMTAKGLTAGTSIFAQAWFRDAPHPDGTGAGLSDAIEFTILP